MSMTLYHWNNSVCSQKVRMVLAEKNFTDWESKIIDIFSGEQWDPEYLKLNPKGVVPTLLHDGKVVVESTLIAEYLDEILPGPQLMPADPADRVQMRLYSKTCDEGLHPAIAVISYAAMFTARNKKHRSKEEMEEALSNIIDLERRDRQTAVYEQAENAPHVYRGVVAYEKIFQKVGKVLADGREWLTGDIFSLAEINLATYIIRLEYLKILDVWIDDRPLVNAWWEKVKARSCFKTAITDWVHEADSAEMGVNGLRLKPHFASLRETYLTTDKGAQIY